MNTSKASFAELDAYVEKQRQRLKMPGIALAVVEGDQIVHLRGFGAARPGGAAPTPHTPFVLGSTTKSFTALAVMQLVEAGKVELDAPVQRYLSWFRVADPHASAQITVRHLLHQTSGLSMLAGEAPLADFDQSPGAGERQARALASAALARPAGAAFEYSNANYNLLGLIVAAASGESFADYVQNHILNPLGMTHTYTSQAAARQDGLAMGHQYWFGIPFAAPDMPLPHGSLPAGLLISSAEDLARYLIAQLNGGRLGDTQILSAAGIAAMHTGAASVNAMGVSVGDYGMGWFTGQLGRQTLVWHSGTLPDFASFLALLPEHKQGVVLLFNGDHHWMNPVVTEFGISAAGLLAGELPMHIPLVGFIPHLLRGLLLIPLLQVAGIAATLASLRRWRLVPGSRPGGRRKWGRHILLPLFANLAVALTLIPLLGPSRRYLRLYMPDYFWTALVCGNFALAWSLLRTRLTLRALQQRENTCHDR